MKTTLLFICLLSAIVYVSSECHSCLNERCYQRSKIFYGNYVSGQLAIDRTRNIVYFHYANKHSKDYTGAFNLNDIILYNLPGIAFTFGRAVDQNTGDVYMGGALGLYKYSPGTNSTEIIYGLQSIKPFFLQYTNKLYFNEESNNGLQTYVGNRVVPNYKLIDYKIDDFVVDKLGDLYFKSNLTVYRLKTQSQKPVIFADEIYNLSTDKNGEVYFVQSVTRGIYKLDYQKDIIVATGAFGPSTILSFVFDSNNNIIYHDADDDSLYYLVPDYGRCAVRTKRSGKKTKMEVVLLPGEVNEQE